MPTHRLLIVFLMFSHSIWAQTPDSPEMELPQTMAQATALRERATQMSKESDAIFASEQEACYQKFLVNSCLDSAKKRHTQITIEARKLDSAGRDFQREAKRADVEAKEAKRASDFSVRDAEQKVQADAYHEKEAAKAAARKEKIAAKARKAEAGRQKTAAEQAKRQAKQQKRALKDAERAAKKTGGAEKPAVKTPEPAI